MWFVVVVGSTLGGTVVYMNGTNFGALPSVLAGTVCFGGVTGSQGVCLPPPSCPCLFLLYLSVRWCVLWYVEVGAWLEWLIDSRVVSVSLYIYLSLSLAPSLFLSLLGVFFVSIPHVGVCGCVLRAQCTWAG